MSVWYWVEFDEILLLSSNEVSGDFDIDEIEECHWPRLSLSGCIFIGEFE